jgi:hypothetical protein
MNTEASEAGKTARYKRLVVYYSGFLFTLTLSVVCALFGVSIWDFGVFLVLAAAVLGISLLVDGRPGSRPSRTLAISVGASVTVCIACVAFALVEPTETYSRFRFGVPRLLEFRHDRYIPRETAANPSGAAQEEIESLEVVDRPLFARTRRVPICVRLRPNTDIRRVIGVMGEGPTPERGSPLTRCDIGANSCAIGWARVSKIDSGSDHICAQLDSWARGRLRYGGLIVVYSGVATPQPFTAPSDEEQTQTATGKETAAERRKHHRHGHLVVTAPTPIGGITESGPSTIPTLPKRDDLILVRVTLDRDGRAAGSLFPSEFASWARNEELFAVQAVTGERTLGEFESRHVSKLQPDQQRGLEELNHLREQSRLDQPTSPKALLVLPGTAPTVGHASGEPGTTITTFRRFYGDLADRFASTVKKLPLSVRGGVISGTTTILNSDRSAPAVQPRRVIQIELTRAQLGRLRKQFPRVVVEEYGGSINVRFEGAVSTTPKPLSNQQLAFLRGRFAGAPRGANVPLLIVLDDSWPSSKAFRDAIAFLQPAAIAIWKDLTALGTLGAPPVPKLSNATLGLSDPGAPNGYGCAIWPNCGTHAQRIENALAPFVEATSDPATGQPVVDVIYIPLTAAQYGAADFLRVLWNIGYAFNPSDGTPNMNFYSDPKKRASWENFEKTFVDALPTALPSDDNVEFVTDRAIVTDVLAFAKAYSKVAKVPVIVNLSWTSTDTAFQPSLLATPIGAVVAVAAAGNHCANNSCGQYADEEPTPRAFTALAGLRRDFLIVMDLDDSGNPTCNSSHVRTDFFVVGFDGGLTGDCGTSFAAPRIAWMLAANETISPTAIPPGTSWETGVADRVVPRDRFIQRCNQREELFSCAQIRLEDFLK